VGGDEGDGGNCGDGNNGAAGGGVAEHADSPVALAEVALDVALELGEAVAELVEAREHEGILLAVELEEEVIGAVALSLGERRPVGGEDGEETGERRVEVARAEDGEEEAETEVGGGFAVIEVGGDEAREVAGRFGLGEGFANAVGVGLEELG